MTTKSALSSKLALYLVTDNRFVPEGKSLKDVVESAIRGGVTAVQYREKEASTRKMIEEAGELRNLCRSCEVLFLVNDRVDVALAVEADGVHLGQDDMPLHLARKILGSGAIIGITVHNDLERRAAEQNGADYVSFAPVFATSTKPDHQTPLGISGLEQLVRAATVPSVAIGGINLDNVEEVYKTGVDGVCVVSAIMGATDPELAAQAFLERYNRARAHH
ncbi:thiamine phosphate synthase [Thermodesulforhabdus norvegica]|uniref:Thiamine-phosphate synthase n=1 Tax=Thermodesulforhabdus norvegica TaxID=39841 RepID=A0A1I4TPW4_9BACT|nr:thiamine phosphate synthase [Thermodesulforhabdus norvegica]SFM78640.1 thiamine-phosphate diphosphorylase [Thermodesulforhabdus norvegica]